MKKKLTVALVFFGIASCAAAPTIHDRMISVPTDLVKDVKLLADKAEYDLPLEYCRDKICYAYTDEEIRALKKYIVHLEDALKACQQAHQ